MGKRQKYEFSIISYNQNSFRNESINIGAFMFNKENLAAMYKIIPDNSHKIKGLAVNKSQKELFKSSINYLDFILQKINDKFSTTLINDMLNDELPEQIRFSEPRPIITENKQIIFDQLIAEYVGKEYFDVASKIEILSPKDKMISIFDSKKLLNNKVKKNVNIQLSKKVDTQRQVDFAFGNNKQLNLIDAVPTSENKLDNWYSKMVTFSAKYDESSEILLLSDSKSPVNSDQKVSQIIDDLQDDPRVTNIDISKQTDVNNLITEINQSSVDTHALEVLIANNHIA